MFTTFLASGMTTVGALILLKGMLNTYNNDSKESRGEGAMFGAITAICGALIMTLGILILKGVYDYL